MFELKSTAPVVARAEIKNDFAKSMPEELILAEAQDIVKIDLRENIFIHSAPCDLLESVIRDNTFDNPKYLSNEKHGHSNWQTQRTIETYRHLDDGLLIPRGYLNALLALCENQGLSFVINDERKSSPVPFPASLNGITLRPYQERAVESAMNAEQGVIVSPTGSGKSLIGLEIIRRRQQRALILVHRSDLAKQWISVIKERLSISPGFIGDGEWSPGKRITVAMVQTISAREERISELKEELGLILIDETHHTPAENFFEVIGKLPARHRYGLSATLDRRDGLMPLIFLSIGSQIASITTKEVESVGATVPAEVKCIETGFEPSWANSWHEFLDAISTNAERNELIIDLAINSSDSVLILCDRTAHADDLSKMMTRRDIEHVIVHGKIKGRDEAMESIKKAKITVATTSLIGEGIDVSSWTVLIMASPISSEIKLMQAIGRVVRSSPGKQSALIYDLKDDCGFSGGSFKKRFEIYRKNKIWVKF